MNGQAWRNLLGALTIWAIHFFAIYAIGSIWPGTVMASVLTLTAGVAAIATLVGFTLKNRRDQARDGLEWSSAVGRLAIIVAGIAVTWQTLPSIM